MTFCQIYLFLPEFHLLFICCAYLILFAQLTKTLQELPMIEDLFLVFHWFDEQRTQILPLRRRCQQWISIEVECTRCSYISTRVESLDGRMTRWCRQKKNFTKISSSNLDGANSCSLVFWCCVGVAWACYPGLGLGLM